MDKKLAKDLLHDVSSVLKEIRVQHFLIDGTLLGAIREGDFIDHDNDMDLGVYAEQWSVDKLLDLEIALGNYGIDIHMVFGKIEDYFEIALMRDGIKIDLFFYRRDGDMRIFHSFRNGGRDLPKDVITYEYKAELIDNLLPIYFQDEEYMAPADPVAVLVAKYGPNWKIPTKDWNWADSPYNKR